MDYKGFRTADKSVRNLSLVMDPHVARMMIWEGQWNEYLAARSASAGVTAHWIWPLKHYAASQHSNGITFGFEAAGRCQGMAHVSWPKASRLVPGNETLYVDHLEIAPWNRTEVAGEREFALIGQNMLFVAYDLSIAAGYNGRLSLAALPSADSFYRRIGMTQAGVGVGVEAILNYFEFSDAAAAAFRNA